MAGSESAGAEDLEKVGLRGGFLWDGGAGREVPDLLRDFVAAADFSLTVPETGVPAGQALTDWTAGDPRIGGMIAELLSRMRAEAEADGLAWSSFGPAPYSMWYTATPGTIFIQYDVDGDGRADRIFGLDTTTMTVSTLLDRTAAVVGLSLVGFGPNDGALALGEAITAVVEFSAPVTVADGVPALALSNGGVANYAAGAGSNRLVFSYVPAPGEDTADLGIAGLLANGARIASVSGLAVDVSGLKVSPAGIVAVDTAAAAPAVALAADSGIAGDRITSNGALTVTGTETGATVQYSTDGGTSWSSSFSPVEGLNTVQVRQTDVAGNTSASTSFSFTLDTAAAAPAVALAADSGIAGDRITSNGALTVTGAETGATVQYSTDGGMTWSSSFSPAEGPNTVQVRQTDVAGNTSALTSFTFTLDTAAAAPGVALTTDSGSSATDRITSNGALTVSGTETGATVQYSTNGGTSWSSSFTPAEGSNTVLIRQADVAGNTSASTSFSFTLDTAAAAPSVALAADSGIAGDRITSNGALTVTGAETGATVQYSTDGGMTWSSSFSPVEGPNTVQVRQTDVAGNTSALTSFSFTLDTAAAAPSVALAADSGSSATDWITSNGALTVTGTEAGATVQYSTNGGTSWSSSFTPAEGSNTILVRQVDVAGNTSASTSFSFTLDTVAPAVAPSVALVTDSGTAGDLITNSGALTVTGTETGATVQYSTNGGTSWSSSFTPAEGSNTVLVRQVDVAGNTSAATSFTFTLDTVGQAPVITGFSDDTDVAGDGKTSDTNLLISGTAEPFATVTLSGAVTTLTTTAAANGSWSIQTGEMGFGNRSFTATVTDLAGNVSPVSSPISVSIIADLTTLSATQGFVIQGDVANDRAGYSVASAGDVNGDGFDDMIVGAWSGGDGGALAGEAYVVFGSASGFGTLVGSRRVIDLTTLTAAQGFIIQGDVAGDWAGWSVSSAGDVNGDGFDDVIVGGRLGDDGGADAGEAYVVFGSGSGFGTLVGSRRVIDLTTLSATQGFVIQGDVANDRAG
ncbi:MAG: beta strand repeat-containing protein, partial [Aestuariivirga sp.]|uniref:beta strand repeat-containing protein n=1 Tax=Aestuariivirga sp. TaxID=2650926 RepID=UPI0038CF9D7D